MKVRINEMLGFSKIGKQGYRVVTSALATALMAFSVTAGATYLGPSGGMGGGSFYDSAASNESVALVQVRSGSVIDAIRMGYRNNTTGVFRLGTLHGGTGGGETNISLNPGEEISYMTGYYGIYNNIVVITKLYIGTNSGRYFSFGTATGRYFAYVNPDIANVRFAGVIGASGSLLDALGVYFNKR